MAFSRLRGVSVVIHQVGEPLWRVDGGDRELHISYHNGDHYNSVRRSGDAESKTPAHVRINVRECGFIAGP